MSRPVYVGVDVGTSSVRAAALTCSGQLRGSHCVPITVSNPAPDYYEQDSGEIWKAVCLAVKTVCRGLDKEECVAGLGFTATCSLVVLGSELEQVTVSKQSAEDKWNVVMWMDHRAAEEAKYINSKPHSVLQFVGGAMSLEMQPPKLLWLKKHLPKTWRRAAHFFDLPDFLTAMATGGLTRSLCSLVCKWSYAHDGTTHRWDDVFLADVGLEDLVKDDHTRIDQGVLPPGALCGRVPPAVAAGLGVLPGTPVAASLIDAHAGALALLGAAAAVAGEGAGEEAGGKEDTEQGEDLQHFMGKLAIISGTSSCHLVLSPAPLTVPGVWGPYWGALLPGCSLAEAGQSATGALCDAVVRGHPAGGDRSPESVESLVYRVGEQRGLGADPTQLTRGLHVYPDYHGNRSPLADPRMTGMVCGLTLAAGEEDLAVQYLATVQGLAYGSRAIVDQLVKSGHDVSCVMMCGGLAQSRLFVQTHADVLGVEVVVPEQQQLSVVVGAAMLAAAAGVGGTLIAVAGRMAGRVTRTAPDHRNAGYHQKKYLVYKKMQADQLQYQALMEQL